MQPSFKNVNRREPAQRFDDPSNPHNSDAPVSESRVRRIVRRVLRRGRATQPHEQSILNEARAIARDRSESVADLADLVTTSILDRLNRLDDVGRALDPAVTQWFGKHTETTRFSTV